MKTITNIKFEEITKKINGSMTEIYLLGFHCGIATILAGLIAVDNERYLETMKYIEEEKTIDYELLLELINEVRSGVNSK